MLHLDEESEEDEKTLPIKTLCRGFTLRFDTGMTKAEIIMVCKDLESNTGGEESRWEPLPNKMGLRWARWPGMKPGEPGGVCIKEIRVSRHAFVRRPQMPPPPVYWPEVEGDARVLWEEDYTPCVRAGKYMTELAALGDAPAWSRWEAEMVRDAFLKRGVRVSSTRQVRQYSYERRRSGI